MQVPSTQHDHRVYMWLIAAGLFLCCSIVALGVALLVCFCMAKWTKAQNERRRQEKFGDYAKIESVSSFVSFGESSRDREEYEALESVSMI